MATRQEIQIALDLIKHVNVPNDLLLSAAVPVALGEIQVTKNELGVQTMRDMTVKERKANIATLSTQVRGYRERCASFLADSANRAMAINGLAALGMTVEELEADIATIKIATDRMTTGSARAKNGADMQAVAAELEKDTPPLPLVRKG